MSKNQRLAILESAQQEKSQINVSSRRSPKERQISYWQSLNWVGCSVGEIIATVDLLMKQQIGIMAIKEGIRINGKQDL
ncbi:MAG: hypothetical protein QF898_03860 [SAR202 cluster bacterium]|jgi:hypothetical protein|nr:hypothetical protein [SAR202 cluster bacterium]